MVGRFTPPKMIDEEEAIRLFEYAGCEELYRVDDLCKAYREKIGRDTEPLYDRLKLLAFIYDTGRVQGIREERGKQ